MITTDRKEILERIYLYMVQLLQVSWYMKISMIIMEMEHRKCRSQIRRVRWGSLRIYSGLGREPKGTDFWIIKNSSGADTGDGMGYFKIRRGSNECDIEANVFSMLPDVPGMKSVKFYPSASESNDERLRNLLQLTPSGYPIQIAQKIKVY